MSNKYRIEKINLQPSLSRFDRDFSPEIQSAKSFSENLINSYLIFLRKEVHSKFENHFVLGKSNYIGVRSIFSSVGESFIYIYPADKNELLVDCTKYPVQMMLFSGLDSADQKVKLTVPYKEAIKKYNEFPVMFRFKDENSLIYIAKLTLNTPVPKLFDFTKNSLVSLFH